MADRKGNFTPKEDVLDRGDGFKVVGGTCWDRPVQYRLAMRWENVDYPRDGQWFTLPHDLSLQMAEALDSSPADGVVADGLQAALEELREQKDAA